jgi:hypothetical protein
MRHADFREGFEDARYGRAPRYDDYRDWFYERGRHFAYLCPMSMPLFIGKKLNPEAISLFYAAIDKRHIR